MRYNILAILALMASGCASTSPTPSPHPPSDATFAQVFQAPLKVGCFLIYDVKARSFRKTVGAETCREAYAPCSTFKVPLALMAFDSGVLKDENVKYKWDGVDRGLPGWNRDHTPVTWMKDSPVWFSQRLTPKIGASRLQKYLRDFGYGNADLTSGIYDSWLTAAPLMRDPTAIPGSLKITAYEQVEFWRRFWAEELGVSSRATALTRKITSLMTSPSGFVVNGKTGSGFTDRELGKRLGWFTAHLQRGAEEYIVVTRFVDTVAPAERSFAGLEAKAMTFKQLEAEGLW